MSKEDSFQNTSIWKPNLKPLPGSVQKVEPLAQFEQIAQSLVSLAIDKPSAQSDNPQSDKKQPANGKLSPVKLDASMSQRKSSKTLSSQHPNSRSAASFQHYEESTLDAWDDGDDDLLVRLRLDPGYVQSTATQVINSHNTSASASSQQLTNNAAVPPTVVKQTPAVSRLEASDRGGGDPTPSSPQSQRNGGVAVKRTVSHAQSQRELAKEKKFETLLNSPPKNLLEELRPLSWSGVPLSCRPIAWRLLSGYLPAALDRRDLTLERKRKEYVGLLEQYLGTRHEEQYQGIFRQIHIDVPRMNPAIALFQTKLVQEMFERILYIWAIRHPASGYVQGINDLVTPFFVVFLGEFLDADVETDNIDITCLTKEQLDMIEADSYWCMSKLLDGIQDNYTFAQPGIQLKVSALKELTLRIDSELHNHIESQNIEFLQFSFRWMNNLLMRELPLRCIVRLWDTYLAEPEGFADYHLYVCAAFLTKFSKQLKKQHDFQGVMTLLQNLPTQNWGDENIGELTAEAYRLKYMFAGAPQHYKKS